VTPKHVLAKYANIGDERGIILLFRIPESIVMPQSDLDAIDCRIVAELQADGRLILLSQKVAGHLR